MTKEVKVPKPVETTTATKDIVVPPQVAAPPASPSDSSSSSDSEGCDVDTEDSMTSDEEIDKFVDAATTTEVAKEGSEKWVNVKNATVSETSPTTESTAEPTTEPTTEPFTSS